MTRMPEALRGRWVVPVTCLVVGVGLATMFLIRGRLADALWMLGIMVAYAAMLIALSGRSELVALLRGQTDDERRTAIHLRASTAVAHTLILALLTGFIVQLARGHDPSPFGELAALAGVTYILGIAIATKRG